MRMTKPKSFFRVFTETGPLIVLAVAVALLVGIVGPASAQFFNFGGPPQQRGGGWFGGDLFAPFQQPAPKRVIREDFSKAPAPEKRDNVPESNVLVLGDAMADWLLFFKGTAATEKPDAIVVMLGLNDRVSMREPVVEKSDPKSTDKKNDKKDAKTKPDAKPADAKSTAKPYNAIDAAAKPDDKPVDAELSPDDAADSDAPPVIAPEKSTRSPNGVYEFREERWVELYTKKIEEMIAVMKS